MCNLHASRRLACEMHLRSRLVSLVGYNLMTSKLALLFPVGLLLSLSSAISARSGGQAVVAPADDATVQELMDGIVDPAADGLWDAVETTLSKEGVEEKQPRTPEEWAEVRRKAITLIEASTLLAMPGRKVAAKPFPAEAEGALDSQQIQMRIDANRAAFRGFARALRQASRQALVAIDAKDPAALVRAGGVLDGVCEGCHMSFWYPNQVIPPLP
jgi:cytochrome c556